MSGMFLTAMTNLALAHDEHCECVVCRAAAGDGEALARCRAMYAAAATESKSTPRRDAQ